MSSQGGETAKLGKESGFADRLVWLEFYSHISSLLWICFLVCKGGNACYISGEDYVI